MTERYICIHAHFYQPPRENPSTGLVDPEPTAAPFHDWNERITAECYKPVARAGLLEQISFNFGPTLLNWLEEEAPEVHTAIIHAEHASRNRFSGHGSAIAQAYSHMILPLACDRDRYTQIYWGIRDFELRFGRRPEGLWLPETAVDLKTLDICSELGIHFTILAPHQAKAAGPPANKGQPIDPTRPYRILLPSGRSLALFFYDGPISRAVAFEKLLDNGDRFVDRLIGAFPKETRPGPPPIVHIATDGESYGHHHKFGEMALIHALKRIEEEKPARITTYGEYLKKFPPVDRIEIHENSSWSCPHGVERWRSDCGCRTGSGPGDQSWRGPLREAIDQLRDSLAEFYETEASRLIKDPWSARNDAIDLFLSKGNKEAEDRFFERHARRTLSPTERVDALRLLTLQRHAMLMYASCGWFFDDVTDVSTQIVIRQANRAIDLARYCGGSRDWKYLVGFDRAKRDS